MEISTDSSFLKKYTGIVPFNRLQFLSCYSFKSLNTYNRDQASKKYISWFYRVSLVRKNVRTCRWRIILRDTHYFSTSQQHRMEGCYLSMCYLDNRLSQLFNNLKNSVSSTELILTVIYYNSHL